MCFSVTHATQTLQSHDLSGAGSNSGSHTYFYDHTGTWMASPDEGSAQCRGHPSETRRTWKTIHISHAPIHSNKENMKWWLWRPNDIRGKLVDLKLPDICLTGEEKSPKKPHPGNFSRRGIKPRTTAWQARMLPPAPQRWTVLRK